MEVLKKKAEVDDRRRGRKLGKKPPLLTPSEGASFLA